MLGPHLNPFSGNWPWSIEPCASHLPRVRPSLAPPKDRRHEASGLVITRKHQGAYFTISHGVVAYFGTYIVSGPDRIVTLHIERSSFPNWEGTDQQRKFEFVGDELRYTAASSTANPAESALLVWKRVH